MNAELLESFRMALSTSGGRFGGEGKEKTIVKGMLPSFSQSDAFLARYQIDLFHKGLALFESGARSEPVSSEYISDYWDKWGEMPPQAIEIDVAGVDLDSIPMAKIPMWMGVDGLGLDEALERLAEIGKFQFKAVKEDVVVGEFFHDVDCPNEVVDMMLRVSASRFGWKMSRSIAKRMIGTRLFYFGKS